MEEAAGFFPLTAVTAQSSPGQDACRPPRPGTALTRRVSRLSPHPSQPDPSPISTSRTGTRRVRYLQGFPEPWPRGERHLCSSQGATWRTEDPAVPLGRWCVANCHRQKIVMQPSSSKASQRRSWLNAQMHRATERGGDKPLPGRREVTQRSRHVPAREGGS